MRAEVVDIPAFSIHADQSEIIDWLKSAPWIPEVVVHGDPAASDKLRTAIARRAQMERGGPMVS